MDRWADSLPKYLGGIGLFDKDGKTIESAIEIIKPYKPSTGDLAVKKTVSSSTASDKTQTYDIKVELSDKTITGTFGDMKFEKGVATFTLKHNETKTAKGLPQGVTYTVEETNAKGLTSSMANGKGTIGKTKVTATCTNTRPTTPPPSSPPTPSTSIQKSMLAKTGDNYDPTPVGVMLGLGFALVAVGVYRRRRRAA